MRVRIHGWTRARMYVWHVYECTRTHTRDGTCAYWIRARVRVCVYALMYACAHALYAYSDMYMYIALYKCILAI